MNNNSYRFDARSKSQFKKDIKNSHIIESEIALRLCLTVFNKTKKWPDLEANGTDVTGEFIENNRKITTSADFKINTRLVEITRSDIPCNRVFHQKVSKVNRSIKDNFDIIFVNGYIRDKDCPFLWLTPELMQEFTLKAISKYGEVLHPGAGKTGAIGKSAYRFNLDWFSDLWITLPPLSSSKAIPKKYSKIMELI